MNNNIGNDKIALGGSKSRLHNLQSKGLQIPNYTKPIISKENALVYHIIWLIALK